MTFADDLAFRTVTYRVEPADGLDLEPFEITANGDLDDRVAAISDAAEARLTGGHAPMFTDNDGFGAVWRDGIETGRFTFAEVDR